MNVPPKKSESLDKRTLTRREPGKSRMPENRFYPSTFHKLRNNRDKSIYDQIKLIILAEPFPPLNRYQSIEKWIEDFLSAIKIKSIESEHPFKMGTEVMNHIRRLLGAKLTLTHKKYDPPPTPPCTTNLVSHPNRENSDVLVKDIFIELCIETFNIPHTNYKFNSASLSPNSFKSGIKEISISNRIQSLLSSRSKPTDLEKIFQTPQNDDKETNDGKPSYDLTNLNLSKLILDYFTKADSVEFSVPPYQPVNRHISLWVKIDGLFLNGMMEPVYGSISLHDLNSSKKISETFFFGKNSSISPDIFDHASTQDCTDCVFSFRAHNLNSLYLIIRIEKTLEKSNLHKVSHFCSRIPDSKSLEAQRAHVSKFIPHLSQYRTFLGCMAVPVKTLVEASTMVCGTLDSKSKLSLPTRVSGTLKASRSGSCKDETYKRLTFNQFALPENGGSDESIYQYIQDGASASKKSIYANLNMAIKHFESNSIHETLNIEEMKLNFKAQTKVPFVTDKVATMSIISSGEKYPNLNYFNNLYIYPKNLNFSRAPKNHKNIQMSFYLLDQEPSDIEAYINDHLEDKEKSTLISYSDKNPFYYDEIKFVLSKNINNSMHILIIIKNITITKAFTSSVSVVGFIWVPMIKDGVLTRGTLDLPIVLELIPGYSRTSAEDSLLPLRFFDNKRSVLNIKIKIESSVNMIGPVLSSILDKFANTKAMNRSIEFFTSFVKQLSTLFIISPNRIIKDFCVFFNIFINLIDEAVDIEDLINEKEDALHLAELTFMLLIQLISIFCDSTKYMKDPVSDYNEWLAEYIEVICFNKKIGGDIFRFKNSETDDLSTNIAHSDFVNFGDKFVAMMILLSNNEEFMPKILENLSVYFDIILKSIAVQNLHRNINQPDRPKLDQAFVNLMEKLMKIVFKGVVSNYDMQCEPLSKILNNNVSDFLFSFFFLVDRGAVFHLIKVYLNELLSWTNPNMPYYVAKFLSIFIKSEEIMVADLIFVLLKNVNSPNAKMDLTFTNYLQFEDSFFGEHYLIAPWLKLVQLNTPLVSQAIYINQFILPMTKFLVSIDRIYSTKFNIPSNSEFSDFSPIFAACLFPLTEVLRQYSSISFDKPDWMNSRVSIYSEEDSMSICSSKYSTVNSKIFGRFPEEKPERNSKCDSQNSNTKKYFKCLFMIYLWVTRACNTEFRSFAWNNWTIDQKISFIESFYPCLVLFPIYDPDPQASKQTALDSLKGYILRGITKESPNEEIKESKIRTFARNKALKRKTVEDTNYENTLIPNCTKVFNETVLNLLSNLFDMTPSNVENRAVICKLVEFLTLLFSNKRTASFHYGLLCLTRLNISKICDSLFLISPTYTYHFTHSLIFLCKSPVDTIRKVSVDILYSLISKNYQMSKNVALMQVVLASVISTIVTNESNNILSSSLKTSITDIINLSETENSHFKKRIANMMSTIHFMISENEKSNQSNMCIYSRVEVLDNIASMLKYVPEIRTKWLNKMKDLLEQNNFSFQAGLCCLHSAMIIMQYLSIHDQNKYFLPYTFDFFRQITSNYFREQFYLETAETINLDEDDLTIVNFQDQIKDAISLFIKCKQHFIVVLLCEMLQATFHNTRDYFGSVGLNELYGKSMQSLQKQKQIYPLFSYFRVAFVSASYIYDGEYVYCQPPHTKLPEFTFSIEDLYSKMVPQSIKIQIIRDPAPMDRNLLESDILYIQITSLEPYFPENLIETNKLSTNPPDYNCFYYNTPFTMSGKARGDLIDQYHRQTIIETETFIPSMKPRTRIISVRENILKPIDVIQLDISKRVLDFQLNLGVQNIDKTMLQLNLQGCIGTTVNQGPFEAARAFLEPFIAEEIDETEKISFEYFETIKSVNKLVVTFKALTQTCKSALVVFENHCSDKDQAYLQHINSLYNEYSQKISPLLVNSSKKIQDIVYAYNSQTYSVNQ